MQILLTISFDRCNLFHERRYSCIGSKLRNYGDSAFNTTPVKTRDVQSFHANVVFLMGSKLLLGWAGPCLIQLRSVARNSTKHRAVSRGVFL